MSTEVTITFENGDKSKKSVITITKQHNQYEVDVEFTPKSAEHSTELFADMTKKYIKHLHQG